ncbi:MAG TPA: ABC transporter permease [Mobilitalea sp.]|nr:ABC transporter permease [Mobilitalea sp.]
MNGFITMIKMNLKLLLRNKGYLAFLIILPFISVIMLNTNMEASGGDEERYIMNELENENQTILNVVNTRLSVKVYDCSQSALSEYVLEQLAQTGSYRIYRYKAEPMDLDQAREKALASANRNIIGVVIYIPENFDAQLLEGKESNLVVFEAAEDGRINLLKSNLNSYLQSIESYAATVGYDKTELISLLNTSRENEITKDMVSIEVGDTLNLTKKQQAHSTSVGYSLAFLTIAFLFSGVFIAATVVDERENRVFNRVLLSKAHLGNYGLVKLVMVLLTVLMQTGLIAIAIKLIVRVDFGIPFISYLFLVFFLGLIFNLMSVIIGVLTNNVLTSNYIAFLIWCISALLAGLYFPLDGASSWWAKVSMLMPQRWVVKSAEMIMVGKSGVYSMYLLVVLGYLVVILSVGLMGMKIRRKD